MNRASKIITSIYVHEELLLTDVNECIIHSKQLFINPLINIYQKEKIAKDIAGGGGVASVNKHLGGRTVVRINVTKN